MDSKYALDLILSNACGGRDDEEVAANDGYQKYTIELHCDAFVIEAKPSEPPTLGTPLPYGFDIRSCVRK
jgi:hypothetical protein